MNTMINRRFIVYYIIFILFIFILVIGFGNLKNSKSAGKYDAKAQKGVLNLLDWDINRNSIIALDGEWCFFYKQFLSPTEQEYMLDCEYINVPGLWNSFQHNGKNIGPNTYGTYRLKIILPQTQQNTLALKIPDMSSSYKLFINDEEISFNGSVGKSRKEEVPYWKPLVRTIGRKSGEIVITVFVSNYHHMKGGIWESILIGSEEAIYRTREVNLMVSFLLLGILLISSLYYLVIFSVMRNNAASLYLALFCCMSALREFLIREVIAVLVFPGISFTLISKLEYITVPSGPILLALSLYGLYPECFSVKTLKIIISPFLIYIAIIILAPLNIFGHLMNICLLLFFITFIYLFTVILAAARKKKPGARLLLFGTFIMLMTAAVDMGYANRLHSNYNMAYTFSIGFIIFILCQMNSLSLIISDMFEKSQKLSKAELAFLQAQIVPHFLYNTLNTVIYLTRESPEKARNLLLEFSNYLRGKFNFKMYNNNLFVTFEHELEIAKSYLSIETVRFDGRLEVIYNIDNQVLSCNIMPFTLQPLVENAVRHGLRNKPWDCKITISASYHNDHIIVSVEDNGIGIPKEKILSIMNNDSTESGTGLYNVNQRMKTEYGEGLTINSSISKGTTIYLKIPIRRIKSNDKGNVN